MRTTKRFTKAVLERFDRQGRSTGVHETFTAWHRVTRGDPASRGRSHILKWRSRLRDLLSDGELRSQYFGIMLKDVDDAREQFKMALEAAPHELTAYGDHIDHTLYDGTLKVAKDLGFKHPILKEADC